MTYVKPWHLIGVLSALGLIAVNTLPASPKRPDNPLQRSGSEDVAEIRGADLNYRIRGTGGIKVSMPRKLGWIVTAGDTYDINVDGSAIAGGFGAEAEDAEERAAAWVYERRKRLVSPGWLRKKPNTPKEADASAVPNKNVPGRGSSLSSR